MITSIKNRYIFIVVPKTENSSIPKFLQKHDPLTRSYSIDIAGTGFKFGEHDTALQMKNEHGEHYAKFKTFGFI